MRKLLLRWGVKYIIRPLNRLQQTSPRVYWAIVGILSIIQVGINTPVASQAITEIVGTQIDVSDINTYLLTAIATLMGSKAIEIEEPADDTEELTRKERRQARRDQTL